MGMALRGHVFLAAKPVHSLYQIELRGYSVMQTLTVRDLARILSRSPATIATEITRHPEKLPKRLYLPGSKRVLWLQSDVEAWIEGHRANLKRPTIKKDPPDDDEPRND